jgi:hypothetical protein
MRPPRPLGIATSTAAPADVIARVLRTVPDPGQATAGQATAGLIAPAIDGGAPDKHHPHRRLCGGP